MSVTIDATSKNCVNTVLESCGEVRPDACGAGRGDRLVRLLGHMARLLELEAKSQFK